MTLIFDNTDDKINKCCEKHLEILKRKYGLINFFICKKCNKIYNRCING